MEGGGGRGRGGFAYRIARKCGIIFSNTILKRPIEILASFNLASKAHIDMSMHV